MNIYQYDVIILIDISGVKITITIIKINPDNSKHIPEISNGEYLNDNFAKKNTANAKDIAEIIASTSPNEIEKFNDLNSIRAIFMIPLLSILWSLSITIINPTNAIAIPENCFLFNRSWRNTLDNNKTVIISIGPANKLSLDAPTLLTASYQVNIPAERKREAGIKSLNECNGGIFLLLTKFKIINKRVPDIAILNADIDNGEIPNNNVRYSIRIDSKDKIIANKKTIQDFLINSNKIW